MCVRGSLATGAVSLLARCWRGGGLQFCLPRLVTTTAARDCLTNELCRFRPTWQWQCSTRSVAFNKDSFEVTLGMALFNKSSKSIQEIFPRNGICGHFKSESDRGRIRLYPPVPCITSFNPQGGIACRMKFILDAEEGATVCTCGWLRTDIGTLRVRESMSMEVRLPINRLRPRPDMVWQQQRHRRIDEVFLSLPAHPLRRSICSITGCRQSGHDFLDI